MADSFLSCQPSPESDLANDLAAIQERFNQIYGEVHLGKDENFASGAVICTLIVWLKKHAPTWEVVRYYFPDGIRVTNAEFHGQDGKDKDHNKIVSIPQYIPKTFFNPVTNKKETELHWYLMWMLEVKDGRAPCKMEKKDPFQSMLLLGGTLMLPLKPLLIDSDEESASSEDEPSGSDDEEEEMSVDQSEYIIQLFDYVVAQYSHALFTLFHV